MRSSSSSSCVSSPSSVAYSGWVRLNYSNYRYRCYAIAYANGKMEFYSSLANVLIASTRGAVAHVRSVREEELKSRDSNFLIEFWESKQEIRFRAEPSSSVKFWIKSLKKSNQMVGNFFDVREKLEKSKSLETRLRLLHETKLREVFQSAQRRVRDAVAEENVKFDKDQMDAFFKLARVSNGNSTYSRLQYVKIVDAMAAYISLTVDTLKDPSIVRRLPSQTPAMIPEPVARSDLEKRCVREGSERERSDFFCLFACERSSDCSFPIFTPLFTSFYSLSVP